MPRNRITPFYGESGGPVEEQAPEAPRGFIAVPCGQLPLAAQPLVEQSQQLYQMAFAQALAERRPDELGSIG